MSLLTTFTHKALAHSRTPSVSPSLSNLTCMRCRPNVVACKRCIRDTDCRVSQTCTCQHLANSCAKSFIPGRHSY